VTVPLFAQTDDDGVVDHGRVVKKRAIQCALSRICASCGEPLVWPVAFIGDDTEAAARQFAYPPLHPACAISLLEQVAPLGDGHLGRAQAPSSWTIMRTGGFDLVRPTRRGDPVGFRANSVVPEDDGSD
jgi:hypothetical protein